MGLRSRAIRAQPIFSVVNFFPDKETALVLEAASDHSRAFLLELLCDVVSPDPGVVKQWLAAKLDFAPAVVGVSNPEFQLRGGRVDAIQKRKIAALVYGQSYDLVALFLWPAARPIAPVERFLDQRLSSLYLECR